MKVRWWNCWSKTAEHKADLISDIFLKQTKIQLLL